MDVDRFCAHTRRSVKINSPFILKNKIVACIERVQSPFPHKSNENLNRYRTTSPPFIITTREFKNLSHPHEKKKKRTPLELTSSCRSSFVSCENFKRGGKIRGNQSGVIKSAVWPPSKRAASRGGERGEKRKIPSLPSSLSRARAI